MKTNMFVNAAFEEKDGKVTVTARLRGVTNGKSFKLPGVDASLGLEKNDGIEVEVEGEVNVGDKYVTPTNFKILDVKKNAYVPAGEKMGVADFMKSLEQPQNDAPHPADSPEVPFT